MERLKFMLKVTQALYDQIKTHGAAAYPYEGCGLLLGTAESGANVVTAVLPMQNVWPVEAEKPVRFLIDPKDWLQAELTAMKQGVDIIGIFHSHPDDRPVASPRDLNWASWPGYSYLITQVLEGRATYSQSWQLLADRSGFAEEAFIVLME